MMDCMMGMNCGPGMMVLMLLFGLLLITLVAWGVYRILASRRPDVPRHDMGAVGDTPMDILNRRYAAGDVSDEEYEVRKRKLNE